MFTLPYDRAAAVAYAHRWAFGRNPRYYDYEEIGGDCTNFASQCLYAGCGVMNFTPIYGWYYIDANNKAPAWTGVEYFWNFLLRDKVSVGPFAEECDLRDLVAGDFVQLNFTGEGYSHTPVVVFVGRPVTPQTVLLAAHSYDADFRPLSDYSYQNSRYLHVLGAYSERFIPAQPSYVPRA